MGKYFNKITCFFSFLVFSFGFFSSCNQVVPDIKYGTLSIVFEYKNENELPTSRLSVFVESVSDVRRYEKISVKALQNNFIWDTSSITKIKNSDKMYAGNTNLVVPNGEIIPNGEYKLTYYNADMESFEAKAYLNYDTEIYNKTVSEISDYMRKKGGKKNIIIYDKNEKVIFYGLRNEDLDDNRKIWNKYRNAYSYREVWKSQNNSVICILPVEYVVPTIN